MKKHSKILAIVVMLAMLVTTVMSMSVFADDPKGSITIGLASGSNIKNTVKWDIEAYKIFNLALTTDGSGYLYTLADTRFNDFFHTYFGSASEVGGVYSIDKVIELIGLMPAAVAGTPVNAQVDAMAEALSVFIKTHNAKPANASNQITATYTNTDATTLSNMLYGYYLVAAKDHATDLASRYIVVNVDRETPVDVKIKNDVPKIDKEVWNSNSPTPAWGDWTDNNINDTIQFRLTSTVPQMQAYGYTTYQYIVRDTMSKGLTLDENSIVVRIGAETVPGDDSNVVDSSLYTVKINHIDDAGRLTGEYANGTTITIEFKAAVPNDNWFINETPGDAIVVTYNATLNAKAVIDHVGNPNKVDLQYSNNPNKDGEGDKGTTPEEEVRVYTFDLKVFKYTETTPGGTKVPLPGVGFTLYTRVADEENAGEFIYTPVTFTAGTGDKAGKFIVDKKTPGTVTQMLSGIDGYIYLEGLDAGTYYLKETQPLAGYNPYLGYFEVVITHVDPTNVTDGRFTVTVDSVPAVEKNEVQILNRSGIVFPGTGGLGRTISILVGSFMLGVGLISVVVFRKKIFGAK